MGRPAKATGTRSGHDTKTEMEKRRSCEDAIRGEGKHITPPGYLTPPQKKLFKKIVKELEASGILGDLDVYILTMAAVAIDRLACIEAEINNDMSKMTDKDLLSAKEKYTRDFHKCCAELCLSPQARAKISAAAAEKRKGPGALAVILGGETG